MLSNDLHNLLPIGSIVLLKGGEKRLMIFGIRQTAAEEQREYDYAGVLYPEGNMGEDMRFMFDHDQIDQVVFTGYADAERETFINALSEYFANRK